MLEMVSKYLKCLCIYQKDACHAKTYAIYNLTVELIAPRNWVKQQGMFKMDYRFVVYW